MSAPAELVTVDPDDPRDVQRLLHFLGIEDQLPSDAATDRLRRLREAQRIDRIFLATHDHKGQR